MHPIVIGAAALIGWSFWETPQWRAVSATSNRTGKVLWFGPQKLTNDKAQAWKADIVEQQWDSEYGNIKLYTYQNGRWV